MPKIEEDVLAGIFNASQSDSLTTRAKFWNLHAPEGVPTYPAVMMRGNTTLVINGQEKVFTNGAIVYQRDGKLHAMPASAIEGGGVTVNGGRAQPMSIEPETYVKSGNMSTLEYKAPKEGPGRLTLTQPDGTFGGTGFSIPYPAQTQQELLARARAEGSIVKVKDATGREIEGFFAKGTGGVKPENYGPRANGMTIKEGDFIAITNRPNGTHGLYQYKGYTPEELRSFTQNGRYANPGNDVSKLQTLDGKPIDASKLKGVRVDAAPATNFPAEGVAPPKTDGQTKPIEGQTKSVDGPKTTDGPKTAPPGTKTPDAPEPPPTPAKAPGAETSLFRRALKYVAPAGLLAAPVIEAVVDGKEAYKNNEGAGGVAVAGLKGAGKGIVDTYLPGARDGYSDITGGERTWVDRGLNFLNDATGTATAIGATAMVAETAGVVTVPAVVPTAAGTAIAGVANIGVNVAKGALKVTGLAGKDQDGGYIYEGTAAAYRGVRSWLGYGPKEPTAKPEGPDAKVEKPGERPGEKPVEKASEVKDRSPENGRQTEESAARDGLLVPPLHGIDGRSDGGDKNPDTRTNKQTDAGSPGSKPYSKLAEQNAEQLLTESAENKLKNNNGNSDKAEKLPERKAS